MECGVMTLADLDEEEDVCLPELRGKTKTPDIPDVILTCIVALPGPGIVLAVAWSPECCF